MNKLKEFLNEKGVKSASDLETSEDLLKANGLARRTCRT
jgi:hypothetical protein